MSYTCKAIPTELTKEDSTHSDTANQAGESAKEVPNSKGSIVKDIPLADLLKVATVLSFEEDD